MQIPLGNDYFQARSGKDAPVILDTAKTINGHVLLVGSSGVGKSHTIRNMIRKALEGGASVRFHVFDVHGDLDIPGASVVRFSEQARCGLNPLRINPDPHFGGVRKCIQAFIRTVNLASTTALGVKQESVLRSLLEDVYRDFGFDIDDAATWSIDGFQSRLVGGGADNRVYLEVPIAQKDEAKALGARWDPAQKHWWVHADKYQGDLRKWPAAVKPRIYPTVADAAAYAKRIHEERFLGSDQRAIQALSYLNKKAQAFQRKLLQNLRDRRSGDVDDDTVAALDEAREKAIEAYTGYARSIQTGHELDSLLKYDSADVLKSVLDRLNNLKATGLFKNEPPPFDPAAPVWRYQLNALFSEEKKMMVLFIMQEIFNRAVQRGEQSDVVEVLVLDELGVYTSNQDDDGGDGIIGVVAREARKFGLALWAANQSPANVPESLTSSVGTKIILGLDEMYWQSATTKLRIETKLLDWIRPHHTMGVQMKERGALKNRWWWVSL